MTLGLVRACGALSALGLLEGSEWCDFFFFVLDNKHFYLLTCLGSSGPI